MSAPDFYAKDSRKIDGTKEAVNPHKRLLVETVKSKE